jgi:CheY-like chemotaxis protein
LAEGLSGLRVLVVEDEPLVAMLAEEMLADLGHRAAAIRHGLKDGLAAIGSEPFDLAFLDVSLGNTLSFPIADAAIERGIPVLFVTGFGREHMEQLAGACVLQKPYSSAELQQAILKALELGNLRG